MERVEEIILQCKNGNQKYFEKLYKHFYGYVMGISLRYGNNRDDAVEILNDGFLKVFDHLPKYVPDQPFKTWLRRIIINTAIDHYRRNAKHKQNVDLETVGDVEVKDAGVVSNLTAEDILGLLERLPEIQRMVFNLTEIEGYKHEEVAQMLNIPGSTSRVYLTRAKKQLRILVKEMFWSEYERSIG